MIHRDTIRVRPRCLVYQQRRSGAPRSRWLLRGGKERFTGRWFDEFAAIGDPNRFEASDVLAVEALVVVPPEAASALLITDTERFNILLRRIPREENLWKFGASTSTSAAHPRTSIVNCALCAASIGSSPGSC